MTQFIPLEDRQQQRALINAIAEAVYGTAEDAAFSEEFVPPGGRVPSNKVTNFAIFLARTPTCLWALFEDDTQQKVIGFILIANVPHSNSIGFGLNKSYARNGLMKKAWEEIKNDQCITLPLNGYTSIRNTSAIAFLEACGFVKNGITNFMGEDSYWFVYR